ncbi:MAG: DNA repair protein RecO [bacterium]
MAGTYQTTGVILRKRDFRERDRLYTVLTPDRGKLDLKATGVRRMRSKWAGHLECWSSARFLVAKGRSYDIVAGVWPDQRFWLLTSQTDKWILAGYWTELVDSLVPWQEPNKAVYETTVNALRDLVDCESLVQMRKWLFRWTSKLLSQTGYAGWTDEQPKPLHLFLQTITDRPLMSFPMVEYVLEYETSPANSV